MSVLKCTLAALHTYPIKSCGGITSTEAALIETGLEYDREWMVVDAGGEMLTQRELPRMALVETRLRLADLMLRAPGMLALHLRLDAVEAPTRVRVWDDVVKAFDMGDLAAQWFSDFLQRPGLRLVRFDPDEKRLASRRWTGEIEAETAFADGFPILVSSTGAIAEFNRRLAAAGHGAVTLARFRPNLVLDGLADAHGEDFISTLAIESDLAGEPVVLRLVKPCGRCTIPDVDPATAERGHAVGDTLAGYRADARLDGALTFGMNAVIVAGIGRKLRVGAAVAATLDF